MQEGFETWFGFAFASAPLPEEVTRAWAATATAAADELTPPPPSRYLTKLTHDAPAAFDRDGRFVVRAAPPGGARPAAADGGGERALPFPSEVARRRVPPQKLRDAAGLRLWHLPAVFNHTPRAQVWSPALDATSSNEPNRATGPRRPPFRDGGSACHACLGCGAHGDDTRATSHIARQSSPHLPATSWACDSKPPPPPCSMPCADCTASSCGRRGS